MWTVHVPSADGTCTVMSTVYSLSSHLWTVSETGACNHPCRMTGETASGHPHDLSLSTLTHPQSAVPTVNAASPSRV